MVVVDHGLTKGVVLSPCNKTITTKGTAELLLNNMYRCFGLPNKVISDWGPQFASRAFQELGKQLGINLTMSMAYHPQTDGTTEQSNQEIEAYLCIFCGNNLEQWSTLLPTLEFSYNQKPHAKMLKSPFYLMYGENPMAIPIAYQKTNLPAVNDWLESLHHARDEAQAAHESARQQMLQKITSKFKPFWMGDKVWLESKNLKLWYESRKLVLKCEEPFKIQEVLGPLTYCLELPKQWKIHPVFHATLLSPYKENDIYGNNFTHPPPDLINGQEEYEVEAILSHKWLGRGYSYLIKWKGYPSSDNSWEPEQNVVNAPKILSLYKQQHWLWQRKYPTNLLLSNAFQHQICRTTSPELHPPPRYLFFSWP